MNENEKLDPAILLKNGIKELELNLPQNAQKKIIEYVNLLQKWNKKYNLTAINSTQEIIIKHLLDSLAITRYVTGPNILDAGSGAGFPGIPLALALPKYNFVLLDSNSKKISFLRYAVLTLSLQNVKIANSRIENYHSEHCFNTIVSRATSTLKEMLEKTDTLYCNDGQLLMMKGKFPSDELKELQFDKIKVKQSALLTQEQIKIHKIHVPYLEAERHLVCIRGC